MARAEFTILDRVKKSFNFQKKRNLSLSLSRAKKSRAEEFSGSWGIILRRDEGERSGQRSLIGRDV